jgi:hypothetical protein
LVVAWIYRFCIQATNESWLFPILRVTDAPSSKADSVAAVERSTVTYHREQLRAPLRRDLVEKLLGIPAQYSRRSQYNSNSREWQNRERLPFFLRFGPFTRCLGLLDLFSCQWFEQAHPKLRCAQDTGPCRATSHAQARLKHWQQPAVPTKTSSNMVQPFGRYSFSLCVHAVSLHLVAPEFEHVPQ